MKRTCQFESVCMRVHVVLQTTLLALIALIAAPLAVLAQDKLAPPPPKRVTVGIALEGGGALGLAHIGVLRWFEQHHIPVDYVSGNSMGGLVGGLYATGHSPDQIEQFVKGIDWPLLLGGQTPYQDLTFRRKEDLADIQSTLAIGFKKGVSLPSGMNAGHQIGLVIDKETLDYSDVKSFDDLPIPFRCVSTELISGKAHVFSTGPIGTAMRATMSLPAIFAPVRDGNNLYVDGMFVDNLPTDLVRSMGPDVVIAIHLQTSPVTMKDFNSLFGVLGRSMSIGGAASEVRGMEAADIVVKVDVQKFTALDFTQADALIQQGMDAAQAKAAVLLPFALDQAAWEAYVAHRDARERGPAPPPQFITVTGSSVHANDKIAAALQPMVNKPIDTKKLDSTLTLLTGAGRVDSASYGLVNSGQEVGLGITLNESATSPPLIQAAFIIDGSEPDNVTYTLGGRLTFLDIGGYGSEWRTDFEIGNTYGIASEYYKRFNPHTKWFFAPAVDVSDRGEWIYSYNTPKADYRVIEAGGSLDVGYAVNRFAEVRGGYEIGDLNYSLKLGTPEFSSIRGEVSAARFRFIADHRDDPIIPTYGYFGLADFHWVATSPGASGEFPNLRMKADYFKRVSDPGSVFLLASGGTTMGYEQTGIPQYLVGGIDGWLAYGSNELRGNQYFLFRMGYEHRLFKLPPFIGTGVYAIGMYEIGKMYNDPGVSALPNDGAAGILARTAFGPLFIGGSVGDTGHAKWFFNLGHVF